MRKKVVAMVVLAMALCFASAGFSAEPTKSESKPAVVKSGKKSDMTNKVNVNTAAAEELKTLQGVGDAMAAKIIEHRKSGKIKDSTDLMKIKGLKEKFIEKNKDRLLY